MLDNDWTAGPEDDEEEDGGLFGQLADWAGDQVEAVSDGLGDLGEGAMDLAGDALSGMSDLAGSAIEEVGDATGWQELSDFGSGVEAAGDALDQQWDEDGALLNAQLDGFGEQADATIGGAGDWADAQVDGAFDSAIDLGVDLAAGAIDLAQDGAQAFVQYGDPAADWLGDQIEGGLDTAGDLVSGGADLLGDLGGGLLSGAGSLLSDIGDLSGLDGISDLGHDVQDTGQQLDQGLDALGEQANDSLDALGAAADYVLDNPLGLIDTDNDGSALDNIMGWGGSLIDDGLSWMSGGAIATDLGAFGEQLGELTSDALGTRGEQTSPEADEAARQATLENDPSQYQTIELRSEYYDSMQDVLSQTENLQDVQFFGAASAVTNKFGVGVIEQLPEDLLDLHTPETERFLMQVNTDLFEGNMGVLNRTLTNGYPTDPLNPDSSEPLSGLDFDLQMVKFEQGRVEDNLDTYRQTHTPEEYAALCANIDADLNLDGPVRQIGARSGLADPAIAAARQALHLKDGERLSFANQEHRMAIGRAKVFAAHNRSPEELAAYVAQQRPAVPDAD
ncbi:hypothetical protein [Gloeobacter kilaueensis]|uniref:Uncharacterized protein n=1 Tax=Gloeobacter kilaueensis (strain ATCC BAA-2537 / CCAP 1431/1 / ULC 316 / JS1) TaxID=1183438 RepID=U5QKK9_GLOK1|nr:hypothetical protein [Gloeobacter kilaueensis]AGY59451.1 hypothetical protein GKIL_3205 [Gloeobacter kilaueensis JS1]